MPFLFKNKFASYYETYYFYGMKQEIEINYEAIRALNPNGYNVQSNDGQAWEIIKDEVIERKRILFHVNHNGTMSGPYFIDYIINSSK